MNIHAGRCRGRHRATAIVPRTQRAVENIIHIGRHNQLGNGQAHFGGDIACKHVPKIAGGHGIGNRPVGRAQADSRIKIIDDLRHQTRPVDRIDGGQREAAIKVAIIEQRLHNRLCVIKAAVNRDVVDIGRKHGRHLPPLHI